MKTVLLTGSLLLLIYLSYRTFRILTLADGLKEKIKQGAIILDVRTAEEFSRGHIEGAVNISLGTLRERYVELDTAATYITTCSHGLRSLKSKSLLEGFGFKHIYNGGAWSDLEKALHSENTKP